MTGRGWDRLHPIELAVRTGEVFAAAVDAASPFDAALIFAAGGVPVLPVLFAAGHKRPAAGAPVWGTTMTEKLRAWWDTDDSDLFGVAVACGFTTPRRVGLVCLDLDCKHGVDGIAVWDAERVVTANGYRVAEAAGLTYTESTISGGAHLWWVRPAGLQLSNDRQLFGAGVDLRVHREYAVVAPSLGYQATVGAEDAISVVPQWLIGAAHRPRWEARFDPNNATAWSVEAQRDKRYLAKVVADEARQIRSTPVGSRGSSRVTSAFAVGRTTVGCHATDEEVATIEARLVSAALANAPDEPAAAEESVRRSLRDGASRGQPKGPTGSAVRQRLDVTAVTGWRTWLAAHPDGTTRRVGVALIDAAEAAGTATWVMTGSDLAARAGVHRKTAIGRRDDLVAAGAFAIERDGNRGRVRYRLGPLALAETPHTACRGGTQAGDAKARAPHARIAATVPRGDVVGGWRHDGWAHHALGSRGPKIVAALAASPDTPRSTSALARDAGVSYSVANRILPILFAVGAVDHDGTGWTYLGLTEQMLDAVAARSGTTGRLVTRLGNAELGRAQRRRAQARWAQEQVATAHQDGTDG